MNNPLEEEDLLYSSDGQDSPSSPNAARTPSSSSAAALVSPTAAYFSPLDMDMRRQMRHLASQVDALKKKLAKETTRRVEAERHKFSLDEENMSVKVSFLQSLERVERELLKYREEFQRIEKRNDWLESMRETFEAEAEHARTLAVNTLVKSRNAQMMRIVVACWRMVTIREKLRNMGIGRLQNRIRAKMLSETLLAWQLFTDHSLEKKAIYIRAKRFSERNIKFVALRAFQVNVQQEKRKRFLVKKLLVAKSMYILSVTFNTWRAFATTEKVNYLEASNERLMGQVEKLRAKRIQNMALNLMRRLITDVFRAWQWWASQNKNLRRAISSYQNKLQLRNKRMFLMAWVEYQQKSKNQDRKSDIARQIWRNKLSSTVFSSWKEDMTVTVKEDNDKYVSFLESEVRFNRKSMRSLLVRTFDQVDYKTRFMTVLKAFRGWQQFIHERNRTRLLSQKVVLDLQTKSLSRAFESMGINMDDRFAEHKQLQDAMNIRHAVELKESTTRVEYCASLAATVDGVKGGLEAERNEWKQKYLSAAAELEKTLARERGVKDLLEAVRSAIVLGQGDLKNPMYTDRYALKKCVEDNYTKMAQMTESMIGLHVECTGAYSKQAALLRRGANEESANRDLLTRHTLDLSNTSRRLKDAVDESHARMTESHAAELRLAKARFEAIQKSVREVEEMKANLRRENSEFEAWLKTDLMTVDNGDHSKTEEEERKLAREALQKQGEEEDQKSVEQLIAEAHVMEAQRASEEKNSNDLVAPETTPENETAAEPTDASVAPIEVAPVASTQESSGRPSATSASASAPAPATGSNSKESRAVVTVADDRENTPTKIRHRSQSGTGILFEVPPQILDKTCFRTAAQVALDGKRRVTDSPVKMTTAVQGVTFCVRPDRVPLIEEGDTRKLEIEILRLRRKFEHQEQQLRAQFEDDVSVWRRRYEHALRVLAEMENWKTTTEDHLQRLEQQHSHQVSEDRRMFEQKLDSESKVRRFYEEQLASSEGRLSELQEVYTKETQRLQGLVNYYETTFGIIAVKSSSELVKKKQRQDAAEAAKKL